MDTITLNVGRHPIGLIKLTWKVAKFMRANVARKKSEINKAIVSNLARQIVRSILKIEFVRQNLAFCLFLVEMYL